MAKVPDPFHDRWKHITHVHEIKFSSWTRNKHLNISKGIQNQMRN